MSTRNFKSSITQLPTYLDGYFNLFKISDGGEVFPQDKITLVAKNFPFKMLSISDSLRFQEQQRDIEITYKLRIAQTRQIGSLHLIQMEDGWHEVNNVFHFINKDGYPETDITLTKYNKEVEYE